MQTAGGASVPEIPGASDSGAPSNGSLHEPAPDCLPHEHARTLPRFVDLSPLKQQYLSLLNNGTYSQQQCAELLGVSTGTLHKWRTQDPLFRHYYADAMKPLVRRLQGLKPKAIARLSNLIDSRDDRVALAAVMFLLKDEIPLTLKQTDFDEAVTTAVEELEHVLREDERQQLVARLGTDGAGNSHSGPSAG
jgi:hypothetical protein